MTVSDDSMDALDPESAEAAFAEVVAEVLEGSVMLASQALLMAVYDNLGKGASGAAVQNLDLMLGIKH